MKKILYLLLFLYISGAAAVSQSKVTIIEDSVYSPGLKMYAKFNILLPVNYYKTDERFVAIYLLHGFIENYNSWLNRTNLIKYAKEYNYIIVLPDCKNSWYVNALNLSNNNYEDYIIKDLIPFIGKKYRAIDTRHGRVIAGQSMGGYGALRFALKYPSVFFYSAVISGDFHVPGCMSKTKYDTSKKWTKDFIEIWGKDENAFWDDTDIFKLIEKSDANILPYLYLTCGVDDIPYIFEGNRKAVNGLQKKNALYEYHELQGVHNWVYWDNAINDVLHKLSQFDNLK